MPIVSKIGLIEQPEEHVLSIRTVICFDDYPEIAKQAYGRIMEYALPRGFLFAGSPFVWYHNEDLMRLDMEMGFPVAKPTPGSGDIKGYTRPIRRAVSGLFLGPYEESDALLFEIIRWIGEHGLRQQKPICNTYLNDTSRDPSELLTQIVVPVA